MRIFKSKRKKLKSCLFRPSCDGIYKATEKTADDFYRPAFDRIFLLLSAFHMNGMQGDFYEFGVLEGYSARLFAEYMARFNFKTSDLHLFDSFEGLPSLSREDEAIEECKQKVWAQGIMKVALGLEILLEKELNKVLPNRVHVIKGYYDKTLPPYLSSPERKKASLVHLDCDLYSSSKEVLENLFKNNLMQEGTVVVCDDWMCSRGSPDVGQRKAVSDVLKNNPSWEFEPYCNYGLGSQVFVAHQRVRY